MTTKEMPSGEIWLQLATASGKPNGLSDHNTISRNRDAWNRFVCSKFGTWIEKTFDNPAIHGIKRKIDDDHRMFINQLFRDTSFTIDDFWDEIEIIDFSGFHFDDFQSFDGFIFPKRVFFGAQEFRNSCRFRSANFLEGAEFEDVKFLESATFESANFHGSVRFKDVTFGGVANFYSSVFFSNCEFDNAIFLENSSFNSAKFSNFTSFNKSIFKTPPSFFETSFYEDTDWSDVGWHISKNSRENANQSVRKFERLALVMNQLQKFEDEHRFFRLASRARRARDKECLPNTINWLYEFTCDYGFGIGKAVRNWIAVIGVGWLLTFILGYRNGFDHQVFSSLFWNGWQGPRDWWGFICDFFTAGAISFSNSHAILGLNRVFLKSEYEQFQPATRANGVTDSAIFWFNFVGGIQSVVGVITLFFLLLTLRNRFKMH